MEIVKKIVDTLKTNQFVRILVELTLLVMLFNVHIVLGGIFTIAILLEIAIVKDNKNLLYIYLFLSFFDEILIFEPIKGSISRMVMVVIILKLGIFIIKNKVKPNKYQIGVAIFFVISFIVGIITYQSISLEVAITFVNILIFLMFSMCIKPNDTEEMEKFIKQLLLTIVWASLISILYGLITNNFLAEYEGEEISLRFKGTYEPNFMSMFINLGIASLLFLKDDIKHKWCAYVGIAIMINADIATISVTGLAVLGVMLLIYVIMQRKKIRIQWKEWLIIVLLTIMIFGVTKLISNMEKQLIDNTPKIENNQQTNINIPEEEPKIENNVIPEENQNNVETNNSIINRINFLKQKLLEGDWDRISSGRIPLIKTFFTASFNRPIGNILFGNDMTTKTLYTAYLGAAECSHCSYIDFLYNFGVIGFIIINGYLFIITKKNIFLGRDISNSKYKNAIILIRILLLIHMIALSMYTKRMLLTFFLI